MPAPEWGMQGEGSIPTLGTGLQGESLYLDGDQGFM